MTETRSGGRRTLVLPLAALAVSLALKLSVFGVGSPFVTIDDRTTFEGGFLVWFGHAPPQRMYLESWLAGAVSLANYGARVVGGAAAGPLGPNLVADAYRDFYGAPDSYAHAYRAVVLLIDLLAAWLVLRLGRRALGDAWGGWAATVPAAAFLLTYNTIWADLVARPDALLPLFGVGGLLLYYRSDFGRRPGWLLTSGLVLGLGAGLKLHLAFAVIFLLADLVRVHGLRGGVRAGWLFALVSLAAFAVSAGIPLFDPLKYVKLRVTNARDDASPWITWGEQFVTMLRGSGWVLLPATVAALVARGRRLLRADGGMMASLAFQALLWLVFFGLIRQLRGYWMLPVLPVFYVVAVGWLASLRRRRAAMAVVGVALAVLCAQSVREAQRFRGTDYDGLRRWITANVERDEPFFVFGFAGLMLPRSTDCIADVTTGLRRMIAADTAAGLPHVERHLKNWEEQTQLRLYDLLGERYDGGYRHYSYYETPIERFAGILDMDAMRYVMVEQEFTNPPDFPLESYLAAGYDEVARVHAAGGGGYGLEYVVYRKRAADGP